MKEKQYDNHVWLWYRTTQTFYYPSWYGALDD